MDCQEIRGTYGPPLHPTAPSGSSRTAAAPPETHPALFESEEYNALPRELPGGSSERGKHHRPARCAGGSPSLKISPNQTALKIRRCVLLQNTANKQIKSTEMVDI